MHTLRASGYESESLDVVSVDRSGPRSCSRRLFLTVIQSRSRPRFLMRIRGALGTC